MFTKVGQGKRNKTGASLKLHGVQMSQIEHNKFNDSAAIIVVHTVGELHKPALRIISLLIHLTHK